MTTSGAVKPSNSTALRVASNNLQGAIHEKTDPYLYFDISWFPAVRTGGDAPESATAGCKGGLLRREGRDRGEGESPLHYPHRPSQAGTDSGLHVRRQGVLDRQRQPELRLCEARQARLANQSQSNHRQRKCVFLRSFGSYRYP